MNKGFTLVELLAVIFILGIITTVAVPNIVTTNKKSTENNITQFKKTVENAAEVYVETHLDLQAVQDLKNNGTELCIPIKRLITNEDNSGLLNPNLKNPENGVEIISLDSSIKATKNNNEIIYEYKDSNNCT